MPVRAGHFSVLLGDTNPLTANVFSAPNRYVGLTVGVDAEMIPRQRFSVVPYAFWAGGAAQADNADQAAHAYGLSAPNGGPVDAATVSSTGNVGIGTMYPATRLDVKGQTHLSGEGEVLGLEGQSQTFIGLYRSASGTGRKGYIGFPNVDILHLVNEVPGGSINIGTNGGNVGINTTSPQEALDVNGHIRVDGVCFRPRVLVRCYVYGYNFTWLESQAECTTCWGAALLLKCTSLLSAHRNVRTWRGSAVYPFRWIDWTP